MISFTKKMVKVFGYWLLPQGIYDLFAKMYCFFLCYNSSSNQGRAVLKLNDQFREKHRGSRCFVLATGPSIKEQNLAGLEREWCFGVSDFYKHKDYKIIAPQYYCMAPMHAPFTEQNGLRRLEELKNNQHGRESFFFGLQDQPLAEKSELSSRKTYFYYLNFVPIREFQGEIDLTKGLPFPISASIMALWIAIYMGFSEIYLLGCDHNKLWKWDGHSDLKLEHFYGGDPSIGYEPFNVDNALRAHLKVRSQYMSCQKAASKKNLKIFNASPSSYINLFPKVDIEEILGCSPGGIG